MVYGEQYTATLVMDMTDSPGNAHEQHLNLSSAYDLYFGSSRRLLKGETLKTWIHGNFENRPRIHFQKQINNVRFQTLKTESIFKLGLKT